MVTAEPMDHDDDVEHLFSWLQTPELRYREFAGAREITDSVITWRTGPAAETSAPAIDDGDIATAPGADEMPQAAAAARPDVPSPPPAYAPPPRAAAPIAPTLAVAVPPPPPPIGVEGPFSLGAKGRGPSRRPHYEEPVVQSPAPRQPPVAPVPAAPPVRPAPARPPAAAGGGGLLGGAYRENGLNGHGAEAPARPPPAAENPQQHSARALDAVFGRLAGSRAPLPDPRDRLRHIPGFNPPGNRSR